MEVFPTLFAVILFRTGGLVHDANAAAVLPDFAGVALDEHSARVFLQCCQSGRVLRLAIALFRFDGHARVFLLTTDTASYLFLVFLVDTFFVRTFIIGGDIGFNLGDVLTAPCPTHVRLIGCFAIIGGW